MQTTRVVLVENTVCRLTEWTRARWALITRVKLRNTSHRRVSRHTCWWVRALMEQPAVIGRVVKSWSFTSVELLTWKLTLNSSSIAKNFDFWKRNLNHMFWLVLSADLAAVTWKQGTKACFGGFLQLLLKSCRLKYWGCKWFNCNREAFLNESAVCGLKHFSELIVFRVDIVWLIRFPGISDQKSTILLKKSVFSAICFLFISKKCLHSRNAKEKGVFV